VERSLTQLVLPMVLGTLVAPATGWAAGDPVRGKREFLRCAICHAAEPNVRKAGPSLATVYGRAAGTVESFTDYSDALRNAGITWTEETLDAWLQDPAAFIPGNTMKVSGIDDAGVRRDIIAYLKELAAQNEAEASTNGSPAQ
jgi:cytochrome c